MFKVLSERLPNQFSFSRRDTIIFPVTYLIRHMVDIVYNVSSSLKVPTLRGFFVINRPELHIFFTERQLKFPDRYF